MSEHPTSNAKSPPSTSDAHLPILMRRKCLLKFCVESEALDFPCEEGQVCEQTDFAIYFYYPYSLGFFYDPR